MTTDRERNNALRRERTRRRKVLTRIQRDTRAEVVRLLGVSRDRIAGRLADRPSDFEAFILPQLQASVRQAMGEVAAGAGAAVSTAAGKTWQAGIDLVDKPVEAGLALGGGPRVVLEAVLPAVDTRQLLAMRSFMTGRIRDVTAELANKINSELGLAAIGAQTTGEATGKIASILGDGARGRATTILRTELGRIFSVAGQERFDSARRVLPGLRKQWRRSGKIHSRFNHDATDGQVRDIDDSFQVRAGVFLRFPRDPRGPAKETINCGCTALPWMETWDVTLPGRQPFSDRELTLSPRKRDLEGALGQPPVRAARLDALERLPQAAARREIAETLRGPAVAGFLAQPGRGAIGVAVVPDAVAALLGTTSRIARLSDTTAAKQAARHPDVSGLDYIRVQALLDAGEVILEDRSATLQRLDGARGWRAAIKATKDGKEIYLMTLHRITPRHARSARRKGRIFRESMAGKGAVPGGPDTPRVRTTRRSEIAQAPS